MFVVDANNVVEYRPIETGRSVEGMRVVNERPRDGDVVIVNGLQRVRPGVTVAATQSRRISTRRCAARPVRRRRERHVLQPAHGHEARQTMNFSQFFVNRPIFAGVLSMIIFIGGALSLRLLPISEYPEVVPPTVVVRATYPGANTQVDRRDRGRAARAGDQRRRGHAVHVVARRPPTA